MPIIHRCTALQKFFLYISAIPTYKVDGVPPVRRLFDTEFYEDIVMCLPPTTILAKVNLEIPLEHDSKRYSVLDKIDWHRIPVQLERPERGNLAEFAICIRTNASFPDASRQVMRCALTSVFDTHYYERRESLVGLTSDVAD